MSGTRARLRSRGRSGERERADAKNLVAHAAPSGDNRYLLIPIRIDKLPLALW